jgi:hypothetical protein
MSEYPIGNPLMGYVKINPNTKTFFEYAQDEVHIRNQNKMKTLKENWFTNYMKRIHYFSSAKSIAIATHKALSTIKNYLVIYNHAGLIEKRLSKGCVKKYHKSIYVYKWKYN